MFNSYTLGIEFLFATDFNFELKTQRFCINSFIKSYLIHKSLLLSLFQELII